MKLHKERFGRSLWLNTFFLCLSMTGIYGLNGATARKLILSIAVSLVCATVAYVVRGRSVNCGNSAA